MEIILNNLINYFKHSDTWRKNANTNPNIHIHLFGFIIIYLGLVNRKLGLIILSSLSSIMAKQYPLQYA